STRCCSASSRRRSVSAVFTASRAQTIRTSTMDLTGGACRSTPCFRRHHSARTHVVYKSSLLERVSLAPQLRTLGEPFRELVAEAGAISFLRRFRACEVLRVSNLHL